MARYRLDFLASLARQMAFAPAGVRDKQLAAAEDLLLSLEPGRAYPPTFVVFRVTGYHPPTAAEDTPTAELSTGLALQHDLGLLIEQVSATLDARVADRAEPVLQIDDLVAQFDVTSKTIQRWRRRGLAARRWVFPDGKRRVGFRLSVVERFLAAQRPDGVAPSATNDAGDHAVVERHLARVAADPRRPADEVFARVARRFGRTALSVEAEYAKARQIAADVSDAGSGHDLAGSPSRVSGLDGSATRRTACRGPQTVAPKPSATDLRVGRPATLPADVVERITRWTDEGQTPTRVAALANVPRSSVYGVLLAGRTRRSLGRRLKFLDDPLYHQPAAADQIDALVAARPLSAPAPAEPADRLVRGMTRGMSSDLRALCDHRVLSPAEERALFLQYNFRKYQASVARRRIDPARVNLRQLKALDGLLARATDVRNTIVRCNLRLVVSVARQHVRPGVDLAELVNEGSLTLLRAVESFDTRRGNKFSTYATLALVKGFARTVGRMRAGCGVTGVPLENVCGHAATPVDAADRAEQVGRLLDVLGADERRVIGRRFGLGADSFSGDTLPDRTAARLERVALTKLRACGRPD